jgi:hypothetical protein
VLFVKNDFKQTVLRHFSTFFSSIEVDISQMISIGYSLRIITIHVAQATGLIAWAAATIEVHRLVF